MAKDKKAIIVYSDWIDLFVALTDEEAGKLIKHFFKYVNDENPVASDRIIELSFIQIKNALKRDLNKWEQTLETRSHNGKIGNLKRYHIDLYNNVEAKTMTLEEAEIIAKSRKTSQPDSVAINNVAKLAVSVNVNDSVNVIVKESIEERKLKFANSLKPFLSIYHKNLLNDFYGYWTQHGENDRKFLAEKQKSFGIERRLETWKRNEKTFNKQPLKTERL